MKRVSAIVARTQKVCPNGALIGIPYVQTWVYRDKDGNWRNCETHKLEPTARVDIEADVAAAERQWGRT